MVLVPGCYPDCNPLALSVQLNAFCFVFFHNTCFALDALFSQYTYKKVSCCVVWVCSSPLQSDLS